MSRRTVSTDAELDQALCEIEGFFDVPQCLGQRKPMRLVPSLRQLQTSKTKPTQRLIPNNITVAEYPPSSGSS